MLHVGHASSVTNDGPRFHSNISNKSSPNPSLEPSRQERYCVSYLNDGRLVLPCPTPDGYTPPRSMFKGGLHLA